MFGPDQLGVASVFVMTAEGVATTSEDTSPGVATSERVPVRSFGLAAVAGLLHALPSLYWALGGTWLLDTVGEWAVQLQQGPRQQVLLMMVPVFLVKACAAVVPWLDHRRPPAHRWVRVVSWCGATVLVLWGAAGMVGAWIGMAMGTGGAGGITPSQVGHGFIWDPLFVLWGALLAHGLWRSRGWTRTAAGTRA